MLGLGPRTALAAPKKIPHQTRTACQLAPLSEQSVNQLWLLRRVPVRARVSVLSETLGVCDAGEVDPLAGDLVEIAAKPGRGCAELAFREVARRFGRLGPMDRSIALQVRTQPWGPLALDLATEASSSTRCSIAVLASASGEATLVRELGTLIADESDQVRLAAEGALADLARRVSASGQEEVSGVLAEVLMSAAAAYESHRQRSVLAVIIKRWGTASGLAELTRLSHVSGKTTWLDDAAHPVQMGLRSILRREADPEVAAAAMVWLKLDSLAPACRDRLMQPGTTEEHIGILRAAHLLANPQRAAAITELGLSGAKRSQHRELIWAARHDVIAALPESLRAVAPGLLRRLPLSPELRNASLMDSISDSSPLVRHAAVRAIAGERLAVPAPGQAPDQDPDSALLTDFCFDPDPRVALAAARTRLRLDPPVCSPGAVAHGSPVDSRTPAAPSSTDQERGLPLTLWKHLARSGHAGVRGLALGVVDRFDTADPDTAGGMLATWRMLRREPARVIASLKAQLGDGSTQERIAAIRRAIRFGLVQSIEVELVRLVWAGADEPDDQSGASHAAATAIIALGELDSQASRGALRTSLSHDDPRVRSNAIESLAKQARRLGPAAIAPAWLEGTIIECKDDARHRVRATAAWLLVLSRSLRVASTRRDSWRIGVATAAAMIRDDRPGHARAGLWLTERIAAHGLMPSMGELDEPLGRLLQHEDLDVRSRAIRCTQRLTGETDESWLLHQSRAIGSGEQEDEAGSYAPQEAAA